MLALKARLYNRESGLHSYRRVLLEKSETGRTRMLKDFTGLTRSFLNLAKPREKDRTRQNLGKDFPTKEPRGRIPDHQRGRAR